MSHVGASERDDPSTFAETASGIRAEKISRLGSKVEVEI